MKAPYTLEDIIWKSICSQNSEAIVKHIDENSILMINDRRLQGKELVDFVSGLPYTSYTINNMDIVFSERNIVQTVYETKLTKLCDTGIETNTHYRVSTTWLGDEDEHVDRNECLRFMCLIENNSDK